MLKLKTLLNLRTAYYVGILMLVINTMPAIRDFFAGILDYEFVSGFSVIFVIALLTAIGAIAAYNRKL